MELENDQLVIFLIVMLSLAVVLFFVYRLFKMLFGKNSTKKTVANRTKDMERRTSNLHNSIGAILSGVDETDTDSSDSSGLSEFRLLSDMIKSVSPLNQSGEIRVSVTTRNEAFEISEAISSGLLDIFQLLIENTVAIGAATEVRAVVEYHPKFLYLTYYDNGKSNQSQPIQSIENSFPRVHHNIEALHGTFEVKEASTHGFYATIRVPVVPTK